ncbi:MULTISPECIES: beta-N-acetylhexosaminidase [unclassified Spirosoma]|uniref:beta-N-acetylhexosaminidase n=1 Tax=unclassified Spirosoma TaxID=2621999 RepID=UPI0009592EE3|nr:MULTISPECIES: beta-N-acetylhexosaminidase [unclassified Spirosoma]MBN8822057.1 beta-N-acetylhexosaminidase [Spirosoma sp.]OJW80461.1 MAG: beta-N-acetylglucosaminidase [Spirosoma sp. 48-14]
MKKLFFCLIAVIVATHGLYAQKATYAIIPKPVRLEERNGSYTLPAKPTISIQSTNPEVRQIAQMLADQLGKSTGRATSVITGKASTGIAFVQTKDAVLGAEGYTLTVSPKQILISAAQPQGFFYGVQSLMQLMPAAVFSPTKAEGVAWTVPACLVEDQPRYGYRGSMLDVGRHFYPVSFIKKYIDLLALHKMNVFHWHLTEDQGWRIEIKKYPELTRFASIRPRSMVGHYRDRKYSDKPYGGFYSQDDVREVVKYAKERFITVIPEIEMPGHSVAVLSVYPELGANPDRVIPVTGTWGVHDQVLFPREETFTFLENVLTEIMDLFPSQYIHIGGDECPKTEWKQSKFCQELMKKEGLKDEHELQSYFIRRIDKFVTSKGRRIIGWDEILEGGLSPNATVMSWRGVNGGIAAARQNHDVIMSPTTYCYLDYYQTDPKTQPVAIGGLLPLEKVYSFNPSVTDSLTADQAKHVLGVQANIWSEYMPTTHYVEYMAYPRLLAVAETAWTPGEAKNVDDFKQRLEAHKKRLDYLKVNYFEAPINKSFEYVWPGQTAQK